MTIEIGSAIERVRELRMRFLIDTPLEAYESSKTMVDRFWPLDSAQLDPLRFEPHIYRSNPNADQTSEAVKRMHSAVLAQLSILQWDYADNRWKSREQLIDDLDRDLVLMQKDGLLPYERYVDGRTEPAISSETARHNRSLTPKIRRKLFDDGLSITAPAKKRMGRKREKPADINTTLRTAPFLRSRENWRADHVFMACQALHAVAAWIDEQEPGERLLQIYAGRYRLSDLYESQSKFAPDTYAAKLAIAIASADHLASGTDDYEPNDDIARGAFLNYGLFLQSLKRQRKRTAIETHIVFRNKLLKLKAKP